MALTRTGILLAVALAGFVGSTRADDDPAAVEFFEAKVRPLLVARCQSCHGNGKAKGGLRLDTRAEAMAGGPSGPAVVPGKPGESLLVAAINYGDLQMPPKSKLPADEIATLTRWVESGAAWPSGPISASGEGKVKPFDLKERSKHWSLQPVKHPKPPEVKDSSGSTNPVDRFLLARLESKGIKPAPEADRRTLARRLTFDLTGLPPSPSEVEAFVEDRSSDAYAKLVDRLLASPHYGERWARHWMDLVRFAETSGHEFDYNIPLAFRYRDYLIRAFNADVPYDAFVTEHLAGDLLPEPRRNPADGTNESVVATGFWRLHEGVHSPVDLKEYGAARVDNQVDVFSKTFLGLTVACARCHDHKFDAITTKDYYALVGFLNSSRHTLSFLDHPSKIKTKVDELEGIRVQVANLLKPPSEPEATAADPADVVFEDFAKPSYDGWYVNGDAFDSRPTGANDWRVRGDSAEALKPGVAHSGAVSDRLRGAIRSKSFTIAKPFIHYLASGKGGRINLIVDGFEIIRSPIYGGLVEDVNSDAWRWITMDVSELAGHTAYIEIDDGATVDFTGGVGVIRDGGGFVAIDEIRFSNHSPPAIPKTEARKADGNNGLKPLFARYREIEAMIPEPTLAQGITDGSPTDVRVHVRGSTKTLGEAVPRRFLEVLSETSALATTEGSGRLALARKLVEPGNPLTPRVMANRLWHHHFGRGLVASTDDFGAMGREPTNPDLLDFLATQFVESGWSIKAMHRLIVTSAAYRMSSRIDPEADRLDPGNELWHRRDVRRLEAESIRDAILAGSGRLDRTMFGPSIAPHLTPFMEGRGRPGHSGPLDGAGRRSIYLNVRRNFLTPMLLAFDYPPPANGMGRRNVSNVPAQALTLMNDPFILEQAKVWASRVRTDSKIPPAETIDLMYREAFGRPPGDDERLAAIAFLDGRLDDPRAWADLAHVLFNVKEFIAIP